jgi:hypothetical protein
VEKYMQVVFGVAAASLFVPVLYHLQQSAELDSLNKDAPGGRQMSYCGCEQ